MVHIATVDEPVLREIATPITPEEITQARVTKLISDMKEALAGERFGVAIAAPQIGVSLRLFIVGGIVFATQKGEEFDPKKHHPKAYLNPEIIKQSKKQIIGDEGCLSVPGKYGTRVSRAEKVTLRYMDEKGVQHERGASGFLARVFQHEVDHLNGMLYIDHALEVIAVDEDMQPIEKHDVSGTLHT